jgi:hypothetical protein
MSLPTRVRLAECPVMSGVRPRESAICARGLQTRVVSRELLASTGYELLYPVARNSKP